MRKEEMNWNETKGNRWEGYWESLHAETGAIKQVKQQ